MDLVDSFLTSQVLAYTILGRVEVPGYSVADFGMVEMGKLAACVEGGAFFRRSLQ